MRFDQKTGDFFRERIEFMFFQHFLKDKGDEKLPGAYVFETGRNEWHKLDSWPPKNAERKTFYFESAGKLSSERPSASSACQAAPLAMVPRRRYAITAVTRPPTIPER